MHGGDSCQSRPAGSGNWIQLAFSKSDQPGRETGSEFTESLRACVRIQQWLTSRPVGYLPPGRLTQRTKQAQPPAGLPVRRTQIHARGEESRTHARLELQSGAAPDYGLQN